MSKEEFDTLEDFEKYWCDHKNIGNFRSVEPSVLKHENIGFAVKLFLDLLRKSEIFANSKKVDDRLRGIVKDNSSPYMNDVNMNLKRILNVGYDFQDDSVVTNRRLNRLNRKWKLKPAGSDFEFTFSTSFNQVLCLVKGPKTFAPTDISPEKTILVEVPNYNGYVDNSDTIYDVDKTTEMTYVKIDHSLYLVPIKFSMNKSKVSLLLDCTEIPEGKSFTIIDFKVNYFIDTPF